MRYLILILLIAITIPSCITETNGFLSSQGHVSYIDLEGGFYGIITDDGKHLDPKNLPDQYKKDGMKIKFTYKIADDLISFHQWGAIVEIVSVTIINE